VFESDKRIYMLLDYQEGGSLYDLIVKEEQFKEKDLQTIMA